MAPMEATQAVPEEGLPHMVIALRVVVYFLAGITTLVCCLRLYIRKFVVRSFQLDDYMVVVALLLLAGWWALSIVITYYGIGRRQVDVSNADLAVWLKIYYAALCAYLIVASAVKISLMIFIMRVFPKRYIQIIGWSMIGFLIVFAISGEFAVAFQCTPVQAGYDKSILMTDPTAKCYSPDTLFGITMYQGVLMFICDFIILVLPMPSIWALQVPLRKRLVLASLFSFGIAACVSALVRFSTLVYTKDEDDYTYSAAISLIWMNLEFSLGLLSGSLSSLRQIFKIKSIINNTSQANSSGMMTGNSGVKGYELGSRNGPTWKGSGITKTSEVTTMVEEGKNESQERIVHNWDKQI